MEEKVDIKTGLTDSMVKERINKGLVNYNTQPSTKTIPEIIRSNVLTYFNFLNIFLGAAVLFAGIISNQFMYSLKNCLFVGVIFWNTVISTIQEIISKKIVDKLSVISSSKALVVRDSKEQIIEMDNIVLDDIIVFKPGNQVLTDSIILEGSVEVNESFITGESNTILKKVGDTLLSGSFIISGSSICKVIHVGENNYVNKISSDAKYIKENNSVIYNSFKTMVQILSFIIIPLGAALFCNQYLIIGSSIGNSIINTVAALIGMIPNGLVLLTSSVMAVSVIRLSKQKVLVQQLYCIETLSRVNVICLDKTGTITTGNMKLHDIIPNNNYTKEEFKKIILKIVNGLDDNSSTFKAIRDKYQDKIKQEVIDTIPFSSERKFSALQIKNDYSYYIGAYEYIVKDRELDYSKIKDYLNDYRILTVCKTKDNLTNKPTNLEVVGFILIEDEIRKEASDTLKFFKEQGVKIKIISGDNSKTVLNIIKKVTGDDNLKAVNFPEIEENNLKTVIEETDVFGRVTPIGKKQLILTLKELGYITAMTGDGVNDVLALKEADCSIAMSSGSDASKAVSQIVLLDNNFASMPKIVAEGRRTINNIERSASLLLVKTIYTILIILTCLFTQNEYFFIPIQLTLITTCTIGIPSFILALEPNTNIVSGNFLLKIFKNSIPAGITVFLDVIIIILFKQAFPMNESIINALAVLVTGTTGFIHLYYVSKPFNFLRSVLLITLLFGFIYGALFQYEFFNLSELNLQIGLILFLLIIFSVYSYKVLQTFLNFITNKFIKKEKNS
ncbi:MAG: HAD-IC family P-type ATPase [Erysipelotrichaceae bacterium]|nr:HAD-IC family P-type ATPase [Erysipelotrichaceae bacterium]